MRGSVIERAFGWQLQADGVRKCQRKTSRRVCQLYFSDDSAVFHCLSRREVEIWLSPGGREQASGTFKKAQVHD